MTTAFVAGATGYTGRAVVRELVRSGVRAIAHARAESSARDDLEGECAAMGGEVDSTAWDAAAFRATLSRVRPDVVFALLGTTRARERAARKEGARDASYQAVDFGLTMLLIRAMRAEGLGSKVIYLSSLGADKPGKSRYFAARHQVEQELLNGSNPYVIARPSFITGPDRRELRVGERVAATTVDALLSFVGAVGGSTGRRLGDVYGSLTAAQLARALVALALDPAAVTVVASARELRERSGR
jgi:nucleoside-diphosphate-sugar epimerase